MLYKENCKAQWKYITELYLVKEGRDKVTFSWNETSKMELTKWKILVHTFQTEKTAVVPFYPCFAFHSFSYLQSTTIWKYYMENSRIKQFISFKLLDVLSSMMKSCAHVFCPIQDVKHPFIQWSPCCIHYPFASHLLLLLSDGKNMLYMYFGIICS